MPFPALIAAGFLAKEDSKYYSEKLVNPALTKEHEGGFKVTRPRFTRRIRKITTGFTDISEADRVKFLDFLALMGVGSAQFYYNHPTTNELMPVRFEDSPVIAYSGIGIAKRWDIRDIKLETV